eukprot:jgi/Botrbrau1/4328/Bobra.0232s0019.1
MFIFIINIPLKQTRSISITAPSLFYNWAFSSLEAAKYAGGQVHAAEERGCLLPLGKYMYFNIMPIYMGIIIKFEHSYVPY